MMKKTLQPTIDELQNSNTFLYGSLSVQYYAAITLGSDAQVFTVLMDTGSSSLAVPSTNCWQYDDSNTATSICMHSNSFYDKKSSKNSRQIKCSENDQCRCNTDGNCAFSLAYADGSFLQGELVIDDFSLGSLSSKVIFGEIMAESEGFNRVTVDGILGLGYHSLDTIDGDAAFDKLVEAGECQNAFSMCMGPNGGVFTLGGVDNYYSSGEMVYTPITKESYYVIEMEDIVVGNTSIGVQSWVYNDNMTIVDSGTTYILLNEVAYSHFQQTAAQFCPKSLKVICGEDNGYPLFSGKCFSMTEEEINSFPNISFTFLGGVTLTLTPQQYFVQIKTGYCLGIQSTTGVGAVLGAVFMQPYNILFDRANKKMGFAPVANCEGFDLSLELNDGDNQVGSIIWKLTNPLSVKVTYENGLPVIGALVKFSSETQNFPDEGMTVTDSDGIASLHVAFSKSGKHQVNATLVNFNGKSVIFNVQTTVFALIGITVGSTLSLVILIVSVVLVHRYYKKRKQQFQNDYQFTTLSRDTLDDDEENMD